MNKDRPKLIFHKKSEHPSEFKFFILVEDAFVGILGSFERLIRTVILVLLNRRELLISIKAPISDSVLVRPFTMTAIACFGSVISHRYLLTWDDSHIDDKIESLTWSVFALDIILPFIPVVLFSALIAGILPKRQDESYEDRLTLCLIVFAMQVILFVALIYSFYAIDTDLLGITYAIATVILSVRTLTALAFDRIRFFRRNWMNVAINSLLSVPLIIVLAYISSWTSEMSFNWINVPGTSPQPQLSTWSSQPKMVDSGMELIIALKNKRKRTLYLLNRSDSLEIHTGNVVHRVPYQIRSWESGSNNVAKLTGNEETWIEIHVNSSDYCQLLQVPDLDDPVRIAGIRLHVIQPLDKKKYPDEADIDWLEDCDLDVPLRRNSDGIQSLCPNPDLILHPDN